jgi:transcriptional regulator with XRE-family HTH domain
MRRAALNSASPLALEAARQLGEAIRHARLARNYTMEDFAARARMSVITLNRIEHGDVSVGFSFWLSAMEAGSIMHLLTRAANPSADAAGEAQRKLEGRKRAAGKKRRPAPQEHGYDF